MIYVIEKTIEFDKWLQKLKDRNAKAKILFRIQRIQATGNFGDHVFLRDGVGELRIHFAKGYRIYYMFKKENKVVLLFGGSKATQKKDMLKAMNLKNSICS
jgi:putative addiction module killer protein